MIDCFNISFYKVNKTSDGPKRIRKYTPLQEKTLLDTYKAHQRVGGTKFKDVVSLFFLVLDVLLFGTAMIYPP